MNRFIVALVFGLVLVSCTDNKLEKPNILFILADDQCYNTINALGNHEVITPTLDDLARKGTVFTTAYNMGGWNGAICMASRAMFNTGRFLWHAESYDHRMAELNERGQLWSREMENLGYETFMTGKWHVKIKPEDIFNHAGTERPGMPQDSPEGYNRPLSESDTTWRPWDTSFGGFWEGGKHWSEVVADETIGFLETASKNEDPFFMYIAFNAPHDPRQSPKKFVDMYPLENISVPESFMPMYPYKDDIGCGPDLRDAALAPFPRTEYSVKVNRQEYYAIITHLDTQVKRILDKLKETGQADNTYIFYTADHGLAVGNHGLIGKQNMYEHSLRPPMIIVGPDVPKGEKREMPIYLQDIMPTTIEYAGGEVPDYVEFNSLKSFIDGESSESNYPEVYAAYMDLQRMIRIDNYKLIVYPYAGVKRLFYLSDDPNEMNDLVADPSQKERVATMSSELQKLMVNMGDTLQLANFF